MKIDFEIFCDKLFERIPNLKEASFNEVAKYAYDIF